MNNYAASAPPRFPVRRPALVLPPLVAAALILPAAALRADLAAPAFIYETEKEMVSRGDFDGDGRQDVVIVDKDSGKTRLGYEIDTGVFNWVPWRSAGARFVSGLSVGRLLDAKRDALAFASADGNLVTLLDASNPAATTPANKLPFAALGPNSIVAVDIGGAGNTPAPDLYVSSIYNSDPANLATLLRNAAGQFDKLAEEPLPGPFLRANRVTLKAGGPEVVAGIVNAETGDELRAFSLAGGRTETLLTLKELATGAAYVVGRFGGAAVSQFVFYKAGQTSLDVRALEPAEGNAMKPGARAKFDLPKPVLQILALPEGAETRLLAIYEDGTEAAVFKFDGKSAPAHVQSLPAPTNEVLSAGAPLDKGFLLFSAPMLGRASTRYHVHGGGDASYARTLFGGLASLADTDDMTVPDIHKRIVAATKESKPDDMRPYTNTIPGTTVTYEMVPIPGGEFLMGTPETEKDRQPDEGPQHRVKISPFWMGKYEVTWNEYELFMFPDDEKRLRATTPTEEAANLLSDAVTRPSKPYVEMSFGMGKDRYPAIAMTQHGANKFCHWLSAKTGHFYRLPTEAEWEYACRAGTTTAYSWGGDGGAAVEPYAWFFDNSDSKYQRIGKKKPNPWGLFDMHGNVLEWCLDQYDPAFYKTCAEKGVVVDPWNRATKPYPHAARGGSWDDDPPALRSGARRGSDRSWKMTDPQLPKSIWYLSDSRVIGFRLVRPLQVPPPEEMVKYWTSGVERD